MENTRTIRVSAEHCTGPNHKTALRCISAARAYLLLRSDHQEHLRTAVKECGFSYLRFHGLYQNDLGVYRQDAFGNPVYSWQYADQVYDFLLSIGLRPFVVLDFMPAALASGDSAVYWERANVTPPASYEKWGSLVRETVLHFTRRYGREEVEKWYFEVWNEPDNAPFFAGDFSDYCRLYESAARAVHQVCPRYRVGGPAVAGSREWVERLIAYCSAGNVPLDFISAHSYAAKPFDENGESKPVPGIPVWNPGPSWRLGNQCYDPQGVVGAVKNMRAAISQSAMPDLELHFTEWGLTWDYWDPLRDSYHAASYILSRLADVGDQVSSISYCEISDVFEEDGPPFQEFHGGFGLINLQGIRKPAYYAFRYLSMLGGEKIECSGTNAIACRQADSVHILLWNHAVRQDRENKEYYNRDLPPEPVGELAVTVDGLKGEYLLQIYGVGYRRNDPYTLYLELENKGSLSREQVERLRGASANSPLEARIIKAEQEPTLILEAEERENDVYLITLEQC